MLITFSGLDGAGKSTLVRWLQQTLERQNRRVVVFHMNDHVGVYAYLRRLRNQLGGAPPSAEPAGRVPCTASVTRCSGANSSGA